MGDGGCDKCGGPVEPTGELPFAQFRRKHGRNPVLCDECREEMARWILTDTDHTDE